MLQLSGKRRGSEKADGRVLPLSELPDGEHAVLESLELAQEDAQRMMELGFVPGTVVSAALSAPGGDPRVYRVDGSEFAIRVETASRLRVRSQGPNRETV